MNPDAPRRSILITGCSSGIGYCTAKKLHEDGYRVFATARKPVDVNRLRGEGMESFQLDLRHTDSIENAFNQVMDATGGSLYALFNNGAYAQSGAVEDLSRDALRKQFETNLFGWHELTCLAIPVMRQQGYGRIIQNSSILGFIAPPMRGAYNASKHALEGLSDTLRLELKGSGIHVSLVEPGPITSRIRQNALEPFLEHIDHENSVHREKYQKSLKRLKQEGPVMAFTLPPEAVYRKVKHALESRRPRPRYYVTVPTHTFGSLKRMLSTRALDWILKRG